VGQITAAHEATLAIQLIPSLIAGVAKGLQSMRMKQLLFCVGGLSLTVWYDDKVMQ